MIHSIAFSSKKVVWSESGEKYAQIKHRSQAETVQNNSKQICEDERELKGIVHPKIQILSSDSCQKPLTSIIEERNNKTNKKKFMATSICLVTNISSKCLLLCSTEESSSYSFGTT